MSAENIFRVTDEERSRILKHMDRTEEDMEAALQVLRDWLRLEPHLPDSDDDQILRSMLMHSKWSITRVKEKLEAFYSFKSGSTDVYSDNEPLLPHMQRTIAGNLFLPLPKLTNDCTRVIVMKVTCSVDDFSHLDCLRYCMMNMELMLKYDFTYQVMLIMDLDEVTFGHVTKVSPLMIVKSFTFFARAFPNSIKGIHVVNAASFTQSLIELTKATLKAKMASRVHVHKNIDSLLSLVPEQCLPIDYGGTERSMSEIYVDWRAFVEKHNDWVTERSKIVSNESLRVGQMADTGIYGAEGSFRKLNVD